MKQIINSDAELIAQYTFNSAYNKELFIASIRIALEQTSLFRENGRLKERIMELEAALVHCEHNQLVQIMERFDELASNLKKR